MEYKFSFKDLELDIRYSGRDEYIKVNEEFLSKVESLELAIKLQSASTEILCWLERDIIKGLK